MTTPEDEISPEARERVTRELETIGRGDPGTTRMLRSSLQRLATGAGGTELQEAAKDILAGRVGARRALASNIYGRALHDGIRRFHEQYEKLSPEQRRDLRESGREHLRRLADQEH